MKKIYISALSARSGGGVTYLDKILPLFPIDVNWECHVIASESFRLTPDCEENVILHAVPRWMNNPFFRFLFTRFYLKMVFFRNRKIDMMFYPGGSMDIPVSKTTETIVAFRNMLPFDKVESARYPLGYIRVRNWLLFFVQRASFRKANKIIFISEYAKSVMKKYVSGLEEKSTVIYHGVDYDTSSSNEHDLHKQFPEGYVLYVSILDVYKAQLEVITAWKQFKKARQGKEKLLLVGPEYRPYAKRVRKMIIDLNLKDDVVLMGSLKRTELSALYKGAILNIYASSCENCPNILLEILASGSPVLCSIFQPMPEIGGENLIYFDPYTPNELAEKLEIYLSDKSLLAKQGRASHKQSLKYSWQKTADKTWAYILEL